MRCYICDCTFHGSSANYPDGKNPCADCVEAYRLKPGEEKVEEGELDTAELREEQDDLGINNFPSEDYDQ
jgi:hypothetical protein